MRLAWGSAERDGFTGWDWWLVKHYLLFDTVKENKMVSVQVRERFLQNQILTPAWKFLSDASDFDFETWQSSFNNAFSALSGSLPLNVNSANIRAVEASALLSGSASSTYSRRTKTRYTSLPVTIDIEHLFGFVQN
ncbi:hypothetical protein quinque_011232 [Culex quinquefasciatus]